MKEFYLVNNRNTGIKTIHEKQGSSFTVWDIKPDYKRFINLYLDAYDDDIFENFRFF